MSRRISIVLTVALALLLLTAPGEVAAAYHETTPTSDEIGGEIEVSPTDVDDEPTLPSTDTVWVCFTEGDDGNSGTEVEPFETIAHAVVEVDSGGTVMLKVGTHETGSLLVEKSMTITGATGDKGDVTVVVDGSGYGISTASDSDLQLTLQDMTLEVQGSGIENYLVHIAHNESFVMDNMDVIGMGKEFGAGDWDGTVGGVDINNVTTAQLTDVSVSETSRNAISFAGVESVVLDDFAVSESGAADGSAAVALYQSDQAPDVETSSVQITGGNVEGVPIGLNFALGNQPDSVDISGNTFSDNAVQVIGAVEYFDSAVAAAVLQENTFSPEAVVARTELDGVDVHVIGDAPQKTINLDWGDGVDVDDGGQAEFEVEQGGQFTATIDARLVSNDAEGWHIVAVDRIMYILEVDGICQSKMQITAGAGAPLGEQVTYYDTEGDTRYWWYADDADGYTFVEGQKGKTHSVAFEVTVDEAGTFPVRIYAVRVTK